MGFDLGHGHESGRLEGGRYDEEPVLFEDDYRSFFVDDY